MILIFEGGYSLLRGIPVQAEMTDNFRLENVNKDHLDINREVGSHPQRSVRFLLRDLGVLKCFDFEFSAG